MGRRSWCGGGSNMNRFGQMVSNARTVARLNEAMAWIGENCLEWSGVKDRFGYGKVTCHGRQKPAHKVIYETIHGPVPAGLVVRHNCDNPSCVNSRHLSLGTHADNVADCCARGRNAHGRMQTNAKLSDEAVSEIRTSQLSQRKLAKKFGVSSTAIFNAKHGLSWKHVT